MFTDYFIVIYKDKTEQSKDRILPACEKINDVASRNESNKLRTETDNIANISENLNHYSDEINSDLSQYSV